MQENFETFASFSVSDTERARYFYEDVLDLSVKSENMEGQRYLELEVPGAPVMVYEKADHIPANFTVLNFKVPDIELAVRELTDKGVRFEHEKGTDESGIMTNGDHRIAWFKDPDGNFLSLIQQ